VRQPDLRDVRRAVFVRIRSLGDTVLFTPAIENFKLACPDASLSVIVDEASAQVLSGNPQIDETILPPKNGDPAGNFRFAWQLASRRFDLAVDFHGGPRGAMAAALSRARYRVGWADRRLAFLYNVPCPKARSVLKTESNIHTVASQLALIAHIGVPIATTRPRLFVADEDTARVLQILREQGYEEEPILLVHVAATKSRKDYPAERFAGVISALKKESSFRPAVIGSKDDLPRWESIAGLLSAGTRDWVLDLVGKLSLPELKAVCKLASGYVGPDSGVMHIADALDTPSVVLLGKTSLRLWHPWVSPHVALRPCTNLACQKTCAHYSKKEGCIHLIDEGQVLEALRDIEELSIASEGETSPSG